MQELPIKRDLSEAHRLGEGGINNGNQQKTL